MALSVKTHCSGEVSVVRCAGRIVLGDEVKSMEATLEHESVEFVRVVLNLADVNRLDSIGLGLLVRYAQRLGSRGGGLRLAAPPASTTNLLNMTKLSDLLRSYPTEEDAIRSFDA
jgi:anti-anti-sigma factor